MNVVTGDSLDEAEANTLQQNLAFARELGAEVITTNDADIVQGILRVAHQRATTQIIVGHTKHRIFGRTPIVDRLIAASKVDIYIVEKEKEVKEKAYFHPLRWQISSYLLISVLVAILAIVNWMILPLISYKIVGVIFLIGLLLSSLFFSKGPILFASMLSAFIWDIAFIPPQGSLYVGSYEDIALLVLYFITAMATGVLVDRERENRRMLQKREETAQALYDIAAQIAVASTTQELFQSVIDRLEAQFPGRFELFPASQKHELITESSKLLWDEKERTAAQWVFENGKPAGWSTDILPSTRNMYVPLTSSNEVMGLLVYSPTEQRRFSLDQKNFLYTICQQLASYLQRSLSDERKKQNEQLRNMEKIHQTVLDHISRELKRPIFTIMSSVQKLAIDRPKPDVLFHAIESSADALNKMIANISAMAQLSEGLVPLNKKPYQVPDLLNECVENMKPSSKRNQFILTMDAKLPAVNFDYQLMQILIHNLIRNAIEYSPPESIIEITAKPIDEFVEISVADQGSGIPEDKLDVIFERFYRVSQPKSSPGVGLGLAIARTIAEIHGGYLKAENKPHGGGAKFSLYLPIKG